MSQQPGQPTQQEVHIREALERRVRIKRRLWEFLVIAGVLHVLFFVSLIVFPDWRRWLFEGGNYTIKDVDPTKEKVHEAIKILMDLYAKRFRDSAKEMAQIRLDIDKAQQAKLTQLRKVDADWKKQIDDGNAPRGTVFSPRADIEPPPLKFPSLPDMTRMDLAQLYELHKPLEHQCGKAYERFHAVQLAMQGADPIPLSKAIAVTTLVFPERRDPNTRALDSHISTILDGRFKRFKDELVDLWLESQNMLATAQRWRDLALARATAEDTIFGEPYDRIPKPIPYYGHFLNPRFLRRSELKKVIDPDVALGNQIVGKGLQAEWVSLDRWYIIGPWTHPGQERRLDQLDRKYPPESELDHPVNLDLVYKGMGKGGRTLRWKYRRMGSEFLAGGVRVEPYVIDNDKFAIWYFYTEVYSDEERDLWATFASDDYGVCWVNGAKVYYSPPETQPWVPFDRSSFRKLHLNKGVNRFLFKLENATGTTGLSVILMSSPAGSLGGT